MTGRQLAGHCRPGRVFDVVGIWGVGSPKREFCCLSQEREIDSRNSKYLTVAKQEKNKYTSSILYVSKICLACSGAPTPESTCAPYVSANEPSGDVGPCSVSVSYQGTSVLTKTTGNVKGSNSSDIGSPLSYILSKRQLFCKRTIILHPSNCKKGLFVKEGHPHGTGFPLLRRSPL